MHVCKISKVIGINKKKEMCTKYGIDKWSEMRKNKYCLQFAWEDNAEPFLFIPAEIL